MPGIKDTTYLYASSRVRALENMLLGRERLERMIGAADESETLKVLAECGYPPCDGGTANLEECLALERCRVYGLVSSMSPDSSIVDTFRIRHDYHNLKAIIKSEASGQSPERLLSGCGRISPDVLRGVFMRSDFRELPAAMGEEAVRVRELLAVNSDAQLCDFLLDRACFSEMLKTATESKSSFLLGYVRLSIDVANLRAYVRSRRSGRRAALREALIPGGNTLPERFLHVSSDGDRVFSALSSGPLAQAAQEGERLLSLSGGSLGVFEKLCDNAVMSYLKKAKLIPFGEQPVISYLAAREAEAVNIRLIMAGRAAGLAPEEIHGRLRDTYV